MDGGSRRRWRGLGAYSFIVAVVVAFAISLLLQPTTALLLVPLVTLIVIGVALLVVASHRGVGQARVMTARRLAMVGGVVIVGLAGYGLISMLGADRFSSGGQLLRYVAVPVRATARLAPHRWVIDDQVTIDPNALLVTSAEEEERKAGWTFAVSTADPSWKLDHLIDGAYVFVEHRTIAVTSHSLATTKSTFVIAVPRVSLTGRPPEGAPVSGDALSPTQPQLLVAKGGSMVELETPRGAVLGTTPSSASDEATADRGLRQTAVPVGEDTADVQVSLAGTWLRSAAGAKLYDITSWPLLPYAFSAAFLAAVSWLRKRILRWLISVLQRRRRHHGPTPRHAPTHRAAAG